MTGEECEISWIQQGDITPLLEAYPALEVLRVRGAEGLELTPGAARARCASWPSSPAACRPRWSAAVGECDLPALRHLELWLGTDNYGGDATVDDLAPILAGARLPALTHLGLRDAEIADEVAAAAGRRAGGGPARDARPVAGHARPTPAPPRCWPASR